MIEMIKKENMKWVIIGIVIALIILSNQSQEPKKTVGVELVYLATTFTVGGAALTPTPASPIGIILLVTGISLFVISYIGFQWLTSNFIWILGALVLIVFFKTMGKKRVR